MASIHIIDVAARDGLQGVQPFVATECKLQLINNLMASGIRTMEGGSFVSSIILPQMQDSGKIAKSMASSSSDIFFLIPNVKGFELSKKQGVNKWAFTISASQKHNQLNVRQSISQSLETLQQIINGLQAKDALTVSLSATVDCPFDGYMEAADIMPIVAEVVGMIEAKMMRLQGVQWAINLADTTGRGTPDRVEHLFQRVLSEFDNAAIEWGFHGHDTYGHGIVNAYAAFNCGVRRFEGSVGGLGGCPFAPGATGNTATEDLVYLFESMGEDTGVDLHKLLAVANAAAEIEGVVSGGRVRHLAVNKLIQKY